MEHEQSQDAGAGGQPGRLQRPQPQERSDRDQHGASRGDSRHKRISWGLFLGGFATFSLIYCVQPLLEEFASDFGISPAQSSLALSLTTGLLAVGIMCAGAVAEVVGRRGLMFVTLGVSALLNLAVSFIPNWHGILIARALEGLIIGGVPAVAMAYLAEEIDPKGLGLTMGLYIGGNAFGGMSGRVMTGVLTELFSWRVALGILSAIDLLATLGFILLLPPSRNFVKRRGIKFYDHLDAWWRHMRHGGLQLLFAIGGLVMGSFVTIYNYSDFRLLAPPFNLSQSQIGLIFTSYVLGIVVSATGGAMADRMGQGRVLLLGIITSLVGLALTLPAHTPVVITGIVFITAGFFISHSVASSWVGHLAKTSKGHASSLYLLTYYMGSSFAGSIGGLFWSHGGWPALAGFVGAMLTLALAAAILLQMRAIRARRTA